MSYRVPRLVFQLLTIVVTEIVWNNARLVGETQGADFGEKYNVCDGDSEPEDNPPGACPA